MKFPFYLIILLFSLVNCKIFAQGQVSRPQKDVKQLKQLSISNPDGYVNGYGFVDLGLPSGTKWAIYNIGAKETNEYGEYYAWGDINTKANFNYDDSPLYKINLENISASQFDTASHNWGKEWKIPTLEEWEELINNCKSFPFKLNGNQGFLFIGKNNHSIFFPAGGEGNSNSWKDIDGRFWTATSNHNYDDLQGYPKDGYSTSIKIEIQMNKVVPIITPEFRGSGLNIRPILSKD